MIDNTEIYYGLGDLNFRRKPGQAIKILLVLLILIAGSALFLLPLFWLITTALKTQSEVYVFPPTFIPKTFRWQNFSEGWNYPKTHFPLWTWNTIFLTIMRMIGTVITASLCAYGFARIKFPGRDFWFMLVLASVMLPGAVTLIPLFVVFSKIKWLDTFYPLWVPLWFGGGAFNIFFFRQFFKTIPMELEEAAYMDGASRWRIYWTIMLPLSMPVLAMVAVMTFQGTWNDFYGPLIYLSNPEKYTLALGVNSFKTLYATQIPLMMAMSLLMVIPMIIVFFVAQKQMIRGVVMSGLKG